MKMNNRFIYGIFSIILAAVIAFIAIPAVTSKTSSTIQIVRMTNAVPPPAGRRLQTLTLSLPKSAASICLTPSQGT